MVAAVLLTLVGGALRVALAHQTLFGDELATYWDIHSHSLTGLIAALHGTHIEITPPLFFVVAWLTRHLGRAPEYLRLPSLVAGTLTIPIVYALGTRVLGRRAGAIAAALTAFSPFMIYYSAEARAYALLMALVTLSTIALLRAVDTERQRWWSAYALCSAAAVYTHYTSVFYLVVQVLWLLWAHPAARRRALTANAVVALALVPWASAVLSAEKSPTTAIMSALAPFSLHDVRIYLEHWAIGYAYPPAGGLSGLPGAFAVGVMVVAVLLATARTVIVGPQAGAHARFRRPTAPARRTILILLLLVATPIGEALQSATGTHVFDVRNLAASWPALALAAGALLGAPGPRPAAVAPALAVLAFAIGAFTEQQSYWGKPDSQSAAAYINAHASPGDVVIDGTGDAGQNGLMVTPGPLTSLDVSLRRRYTIFRAGTPQEHDHPFAFADPQQTLLVALSRALAAVRDQRLVIVTTLPRGGALSPLVPPGYRLAEHRVFPGILGTAVRIYTRASTSGG